MDFSYTEDQILLKQTARSFAEKEILPSVSHRDIESEFPFEIIRKMGDLGFMGMMVPVEWGGAGLDTLSYAITVEEISRVDASVAVIMSVVNSLVCYILNEYGTEAQKQKYLIPLAQGKIIGAFSLSEPEAGSDATNQNTLARKVDGGWVIEGTKNWVTNGTVADFYIVFVQTNKLLAHRGISAFIVDKNSNGLKVGRKEDKMGIRSSDTCSLFFNECFVPDENLIWEEGKGFKLAMNSLNGGRIGIAAQAVGIAQAAFEAAVKYSKERKAFGKYLSEHQAIQFKLAEMATNIEAARLLVHKSAYLKDAKEDYAKFSAMAKLYASRVAVECSDEAVQIFGGYGYVKEYPVEKYYRDAKITEIYEGTSEIQKIIIARNVIK